MKNWWQSNIKSHSLAEFWGSSGNVTLTTVFVLVIALCAVTACGSAEPTCPHTGDATIAPSAGCFAVDHGGLLLVQGLNGKVSLPGGSSQAREAAQCTAVRETWEETGLKLQPRELLSVFDTGFHLYRCDSDADTGEINPPPRLEVQAAFYLSPEQFTNYEWRFVEQLEPLQMMLRQALEREDNE